MTANWINTVGYIIVVFCIILLLYLLFAYFALKKKMQEIFGNELSKEFQMLRRSFTVMVVVYVFTALYYIIFGHFYLIICQTYIRWMLNVCIQLVLEAAIILPIMYMHHKCA